MQVCFVATLSNAHNSSVTVKTNVSQDEDGGYLHNAYFTKQLDTGKPCVICQDTSRNVTLQREQRRTGRSDVYQQPDHRTDSARIVLLHRSNTQSGFLLDVVLRSLLFHTPSQDQQTTTRKVMLMGLFLNVYFTKRFFPGLDEGTFHNVCFSMRFATVLCTEAAQSRA